MNRLISIAVVVLVPLLIVAYDAFYTVNETEQVIMICPPRTSAT